MTSSYLPGNLGPILGRWALAVVVAVVAVFATAAPRVAVAAAQPAIRLTDRGGATLTGVVMRSEHGDRIEASNNKGMAILFWIFAAVAVGGALFVITRRNLIAAVMGMVGSFLGIAAVYMMLYAHFLAVVQVLVYAGAIMVLFVFVIMILNRPEDEPVAPSGRIGQGLGVLAGLYLVARIGSLLIHVRAPAAALAAPAAVDGNAWGTTKAVGLALFNDGLFPFEAISVLLLIAVVGAIAIARPLKDDDAEATGDAAGAATSGHGSGGHS
jgi:NADH-quinone oxidoreductase subunit J